MVESSTIESLRDALAPVEALRGEHSQLETWVRESFAALDALHDELSEWQRELTRQQAALDQREAAFSDASDLRTAEAVAAVEQRLGESREECRQLEAENAEQLQALEQLDRQLAVAKAELRVTNKRADELTEALEAERNRAAEEHRLWTGEFRELRRLIELQNAMLGGLAGGAAPENNSPLLDEEPTEEGDGATNTAELRRRATARRASFNRPA